MSWKLLLIGLFVGLVHSCTSAQNHDHNNSNVKMNINNPYYSRTDTTTLNVSDEEWKAILPEDLYYIARLAGTERPFTGKYWDQDLKGSYYCAVCGNHLFDSNSKFASTCGWPSFFESARDNAMLYIDDYSHGMYRIEVKCARCQSHLGHIFDDGPPPTNKRYCMNGGILDFEPFTE